MGKGGSSGRRRRAGALGGGGGAGSKRPRGVAEEDEEMEEGNEDVEAGAGAAEGEDYCFVCKDGGDLLVCDFRGCHKAYHPACVGKDSDFLSSDEKFICEWHKCFICEGRSRYYCFCCPWHTFCQVCVTEAEFVPVLRKTKGFCSNCLRMAIMIEKNVDVDSDGERVDFNDRATYEFLFKEYWEIVKDKEGMTLDKLEEAYGSLKRGLNCKQGPDLEKVCDEDCSSDDDFVGKSDDEERDPSSLIKSNGTSKKIKSFLKESKSVKNDYVGWGSKKLIEFLYSIGRDTSNSLDQFGAAEVVKEYIQQKNLLPKSRKKVVICDDRLKSLFRKSKVKYNRIHSLLEKHIAANVMASEDETLSCSEDDIKSFVAKKAHIASYVSSAPIPKRTPEINKSCFASLVRDNINLIYLKGSLVVDLLKEPDTFESKVIGCFVRVKNDPKDYGFYMHKKLFQLGLVTGIKKSPEEYKIKDISTDVLLCISNTPDVKISMLSNEDFDEEELQDLRLLAQNESFKRLTVGELEEKARSLRKDIMSHLLRKPSEQQRLLEEVPQVIPEIEDSKDTEFEVTAQHKPIQKSTVPCQGTNGESVVSLKRCSEEIYKGTNGTRASFLKSCAEKKFKATNGYTDGGTAVTHTQKQGIEATKAKNGGDIPSVQKLDAEDADADAGVKASTDGGTSGTCVQRWSTEATIAHTASDAPGTSVHKQCTKATNAYTDGGTAVTHTQKQRIEATKAKNGGDIPSVQKLDAEDADAGVKASTDGGTSGTCVQRRSTEATIAHTASDAPGTSVHKQCTKGAYVITIEDDDDDCSDKGGQAAVVDLEADDARDTQPIQHEESRGRRHMMVNGGASLHGCIWYYIDPQGDEQGPFPMEYLCNWRNNGFFTDDFKVWRTGQSSNEAILLIDALRMTRLS
ncbi:hypothetical protein U9M48_044030 [Paspalum notatum var. saurae]|uniref:Uncharacterized protein n=1 Tax=Paspalum notatum var. saurae TaxID=547442 RepID=A0AAQ3UY68_PASNO